MGRGLMADNKDMSMMMTMMQKHKEKTKQKTKKKKKKPSPPLPSPPPPPPPPLPPWQQSNHQHRPLPSKRKPPAPLPPHLSPSSSSPPKLPKLVLKFPSPAPPPPPPPQQHLLLPPPTPPLPPTSHAFQHSSSLPFPQICPPPSQITPLISIPPPPVSLPPSSSDPSPKRPKLHHPTPLPQHTHSALVPLLSSSVPNTHPHLHGLPSPPQISVKKLSLSPNQEGSHGSHHDPSTPLHHASACHNPPLHHPSRSGSVQSSSYPSPSAASHENPNHSKLRKRMPGSGDASKPSLTEQEDNHLPRLATESGQISLSGSNAVEKEASQQQFSACSSPKLPDVNDRQSSQPIPGKKALRGVLDKLQKKDKYAVFARPVNAEEVPNYYDIIKDPMDFGTIRKRISSDHYTSLNSFQKDIFLICDNAMKFNAKGTIYYRHAHAIKDSAERIIRDLRKSGYSLEEKEIVARKKIGKKSHKKKIYAPVSMDRTSGSLATGRDLGGGAQAPGRLLEKHGSNVYSGSPSEITLDDASGYLLRSTGAMNEWKRLDENRRSTYKSPSIPMQGSNSLLSMISGDTLHVVPTGYQIDFLYARSLARFAVGLGPSVWKTAAEKIRRTLPPGIPFGPGWIGEREAPASYHLAKQQRQVQADGQAREVKSLTERSLPNFAQQHNLHPRDQHTVNTMDFNDTVAISKDQEMHINNKIADNSSKLEKHVNLNRPVPSPSENARSNETCTDLVRSLSAKKHLANNKVAISEKKIIDSIQVSSSLSCQKNQAKYAPNLNLPAQHAQEIDCSEGLQTRNVSSDLAQKYKEQACNTKGLDGSNRDIVIVDVGKGTTLPVENKNCETQNQSYGSGNQSQEMSSTLQSGALVIATENLGNSGLQSVNRNKLVTVSLSAEISQMNQQRYSDQLQANSSSAQFRGNPQAQSGPLQGSSLQEHSGHLQGSRLQIHSNQLQRSSSSNPQTNSPQLQGSSCSSTQSYSEIAQSTTYSRFSSVDQKTLPNGLILHVSHPLQQQQMNNIWHSNIQQEPKSISHQPFIGAGVTCSTNVNLHGQTGPQEPEFSFPGAPDLNVSLSAVKTPLDQSSVSETQQPDLALQL